MDVRNSWVLAVYVLVFLDECTTARNSSGIPHNGPLAPHPPFESGDAAARQGVEELRHI